MSAKHRRSVCITVGAVVFIVLFFFVYSSNRDDQTTPDLVASVKRFMFFVGYQRSGHSIIGALLDAHPHVAIAHEFKLFSRFDQLNMMPSTVWKKNLFDKLYSKGVDDAQGRRMDSTKGYTLSVEGLWQGTFDGYIEVIGDKSGGNVTLQYLKDKEEVKRNYAKLKTELGIPVLVIHALRNPFDIISTHVAIEVLGLEEYGKFKLSSAELNVSDEVMGFYVNEFFRKMEAVTEMIEELFGRKNVLEVHNCDLVGNPRGTLEKIFAVLELHVSDHFLDLCAAKVYKSVSRSRDTIVWSLKLKEMMQIKMKDYKMLDRYSFTSDQC